MKEIIAHDIKQNALLIKTQATRFKENLSDYFKTYQKQQKKMISLLHYLETHPNNFSKAKIIQALTELINNTDIFLFQQNHLSLIAHDLETYANDLSKDITWFSGSDIPQKEENPILSKAKHIVQTEPSEILNCREQINLFMRSYEQIQKQKGLSFDDDKLDSRINLQMHGYNLRQIFKNLFDNAIKYTIPNTIIKIAFIESQYALTFTVSNWANCLQEGEEFRIFDETFRGYNATNSQIEGQGKGLFIVKKICNLYHIDIEYNGDQKSPVGCLHIFTLSFPLQMMEKTDETSK